MQKQGRRTTLFIFCFFLLSLGLLYAGGGAEPDSRYDALNPPPPEIPGVPPEIPRVVQSLDDQLSIIEFYGQFLQAARDLLKDSRRFGLERNAAGIQSFRTVRQHWLQYFSQLTYRPKDDTLTPDQIASFFDGLSTIDADLNQVVRDLNSFIDSQRVLTSDEYNL